MKSNLFLGLTVHLLYAITIDLLVHRPAQTIQLDHEMGNNPGPLATVHMALTCTTWRGDGKICLSWYYYCHSGWLLIEPSSACFHHYGQFEGSLGRSEHDSRSHDDVSVFRAMKGRAEREPTRTGDVTDNLEQPFWRSLTPSKKPTLQ